MKTKAKKELHAKTINELQAAVKQAKADLFKQKMTYVQRKLKDVASIRRKQKEIALLLTVLREKELKDENA